MENDQDSKSGGDDINRCNKMEVIISEKNKNRLANFWLLKNKKMWKLYMMFYLENVHKWCLPFFDIFDPSFPLSFVTIDRIAASQIYHKQISSKVALISITSVSKMEKIVGNPGFQHLAENIFWNLDAEDLKICAQINKSCTQILQNPIFCLSKFKRISTENRKHWRIKAIQSVKSSDTGIAIISYLK